MISRYLINTAVREYPDRVALIHAGARLTFKELDRSVNRLANALLDLGLRKGERVAILLKNGIEFIETDFALSKTGLVRVALNYRLGVQDHEYVIRDSGAKVLIFGEEFILDIGRLREKIPGVEKFICVAGTGDIALPPDCLSYAQLVTQSAPDDPGIAVEADDLHQLTYTSGTTGKPKGVMISDGAWCSATINIVLNYGPITDRDVILNLQPLSHGAGYFVMPYFIRGATNILADFDPEGVFATVEREGVTVIKLVPVMLYKLTESPARHRYDLSSLKHIIYGGSPIDRRRLQEALGFFGHKLSQLYGQAEVPMCLTTLSRGDHLLEGTDEELKRLESAGKPCLNVEVKVVDEAGQELKAGEKGEVVARGSHIMNGYWKNPEATAKTLRGGWVYTGDIGYMDSKGFLFLVDRKNDVIISGAFNIYPAEVEIVIAAHPGVQESCVIGVPDDRWGEAVKAVVVGKPGFKVSEAELIAHCKSSGLGFRSPKSVDFVDEIPRNPYGKVDKKRLRGPYWSHLGKEVH
jgi:acyl-CoA synthetase (AMP-forming)/AMP-acid ligase II